MSAEAEAYVERHSPYKGATFQVHGGIAKIVNEVHEHLFWMTRKNFAAKLRITPRAVTEALSALVRDGFLELVEQPKGGASTYRFLYPDRAVAWDSNRRERPLEAASTPPGTGFQPPVNVVHTPLERASTHRSEGERKQNRRGEDRRWRVVPPGTELTLTRRQMAEREGLCATDQGRQINREWDKFCRHEFARPKSDVDRAWQNWCAKEAEWKGESRPTVAEVEAEAARERRRIAGHADYEQRLAASRAKKRPPSEPTPLDETNRRALDGLKAVMGAARKAGFIPDVGL